MKVVLAIIAVLATVAMPAHAQNFSDECKRDSMFAYVTAGARDNGVPLGKMLAVVKDSQNRRIVRLVYAYPDVSKEKHAETVLIACEASR